MNNLQISEKFYDQWVDDNGLLHVYPQPSDSENGILFTSYFFFLFKNSCQGQWSRYLKVSTFENALYSSIHSNLRIRVKGPWVKEEDAYFSHDNDTGYRALALGINHESGRKIWFKEYFIKKNFMDRLHPRDWGFRLACMGGVFRLLAVPLLWITSAAMIISCAQNYKIRNGNKILKTDGKLLAWLRCQVLYMPITFYICTKLIERNKNFTSWKNCFRIYFKCSDHPCNLFGEDVYNMRKRLF